MPPQQHSFFIVVHIGDINARTYSLPRRFAHSYDVDMMVFYDITATDLCMAT